jgi:D-aminopeptidase
MFPGGTGTSSRVVKGKVGTEEKYTVGVLVQSNYGHCDTLQIGGVPIGELIIKERGSPVHVKEEKPAPATGKADDGSIVIYLMFVS